MAEIHWIKLKTTMFDDEKIRLIESMPEADAIINIWIRLLILAGKTNDSGLIYIQRNMPYSAEMLSTLFNRKVNVIKLALTTLAKFDMINVSDDGLIEITNWEKHQNIEGMERVRSLAAQRVKKHRDKEKAKKLESNVTVTLRNATDSDSDTESDKNKEHSAVKPAQLALKDEFEQLWKNYPNKKGKNAAFNHYKAWRRKSAKNTNEYLEQKLADYLRYCEIEKDWYHPMNGSTWFNGRFEDDLKINKPKSNRYNHFEGEKEDTVYQDDLPF